MRAYVGGSWGAWSTYKTFTVVNPVPITQSPGGVIYTQKPTYKWSMVSGATKYRYQVYKGVTKVIDKVVTSTSDTPTIALAFATHKWRVQAYAGGAWRAYSAYKNFTVTPATTRVSVSSSGEQGNNESIDPAITADGRFVAFDSNASNLVDGDTNNFYDIFVYDIASETITRVSVDSSGNQANSSSNKSNLSADGRFVAFYSDATNLVDNDTNDHHDVFVRDLAAGTTTRVSLSTGGDEGDWGSWESSISADGRYVAFSSGASNLVSGDTGGYADIFIHDRQTGTTIRASVSSGGTQGNGHSESPYISDDGRFVAFQSAASNLVGGDTNASKDVFVHNIKTGATTRVSLDSSDAQGIGASYFPSISSDGHYVAFESEASNLVNGDTNGALDIFLRDRWEGTTIRLSLKSNDGQANNSSHAPCISADGDHVTFASDATNLVTGDTNGVRDIFVRAR